MNRSEGNQGRLAPGPWFDLEGWVEGLAGAVVAGIERQASPQGLTAVEFTLMRAFVHSPARTIVELGETLPIEAEQLGALVRALTERGLLRTVAAETGNGLPLLALTQSGRELVWRVDIRVRAEETRLLAGVGPEEMATLSAVASRIVANHAALEGRL